MSSSTKRDVFDSIENVVVWVLAVGFIAVIVYCCFKLARGWTTGQLVGQLSGLVEG